MWTGAKLQHPGFSLRAWTQGIRVFTGIKFVRQLLSLPNSYSVSSGSQGSALINPTIFFQSGTRNSVSRGYANFYSSNLVPGTPGFVAYCQSNHPIPETRIYWTSQYGSLSEGEQISDKIYSDHTGTPGTYSKSSTSTF